MENTSDNLIYSWMPNCDRMLNMILHNDNIPFYPSQDNFNTYKAFDFTTQRNFDEDEDYLLTFLPSLLITISSIFRSQATSISHTGC